MSPTASQIRAARALLDWSAADLSERSGVSLSTIQNFERGRSKMMAANMRELVRAVEAAGVEFTDDGARVGVSHPRGE